MIKKSKLWCAMLLFGLGSMACDDEQKQKNVTGEDPQQKVTPSTTPSESVTPRERSNPDSKVCRSYFRIYDVRDGLYSQQYFTSYQAAMAYKN